MTYDLDIAEKLSWHKQVVFPLINIETLGSMSDDTLQNFISYCSKLMSDDADIRKEQQSELDDWEKENGQDALYWNMKVYCDRETLSVACTVVDRERAIALLRKRIENTVNFRFMKPQDIFPDDEDDDF